MIGIGNVVNTIEEGRDWESKCEVSKACAGESGGISCYRGSRGSDEVTKGKNNEVAMVVAMAATATEIYII